MNLLKDNWTYAKVSDFAELLRGISYKKDESRKESQKGYKPMLRSNNINYELNFIDLVYVPEKKIKSIQFIKEGDIIFAMSSGSKHLVGKSAQSKCNYDGSYGAFCGLLRVSNLMNKKYVGLFFKSQEYRKYISRISKGTNINNLKRDYILEIDFPLAPLNEQNRIVKKIEELFSSLDIATEDLKKTRELLKVYRQSLLLNMYFPKENWEKKSFNECFISIPPGDKKIKQREYLLKAKIPIIDQGELLIGGYTNDKTVIQNVNLPIIIFGDHSRRFKYIDFKFAVGADGTKILKVNGFLYPKFAYYHCLILRYLNKGYSRHFQYLRKTFLFYPKSIDEQKSIVNIIESRLSICDKFEETIEQSLKKIEYLRQSILKKAFEGKLVSQDPNDLPAGELLKQIKIEKDQMGKNGK